MTADQHEWPYTTPSGHTYEEPTTYRDLRARGNDLGQGTVEGWDPVELPPQPTWAMLGIALREVDRLAERDYDHRAERRAALTERFGAAEADGLMESMYPRTLRRFELHRNEDVTGVSGTGVVAWGVEFPDGTVALRWNTEWPTSVVFHDRGVEAVEHVHGHSGATRIVWLDGG